MDQVLAYFCKSDVFCRAMTRLRSQNCWRMRDLEQRMCTAFVSFWRPSTITRSLCLIGFARLLVCFIMSLQDGYSLLMYLVDCELRRGKHVPKCALRCLEVALSDERVLSTINDRDKEVAAVLCSLIM